MDIVRNADGTLVVPVQQERRPDPDDAASPPADGRPVAADTTAPTVSTSGRKPFASPWSTAIEDAMERANVT